MVVLHRNNAFELAITNIQGVKAEAPDGTPKEAADKIKVRGIEVYRELNKELGCDWRAYFVTQIVFVGQKKGIVVHGQMPWHYIENHPIYPTLERQYAQAYREAGMRL